MVDQCVNLICTNPRHSICIRRIQQLSTQEMNFVRLSHDRVTYDVDRDVSTAILLVFII